jgi:tetratricopeptide (TPR) repeat protein
MVLPGLLLLVACLTAAAHWPVLSVGALSFDDSQFLTENHLVANPSWGSVGRFFGEVFHPSTVQGYYLPLAMTSLMFDYAAGGRPDYLRPFHRTSLALHVADTLLVLVLLYALFGDPWVAAAVSLIFGLHPLTVEPIAWVGERKTLLAGLFGLLCLIFYVRYARGGGRLMFAAAVVAYLLALLSKPTSWPLWLVLILMDCWPLGRLSRRTIFEKWPFYIIAGLSAVITLFSHAETAGIGASGSMLQAPSRVGYLVAFYAGKIVFPSRLSSVYPLPEPFSLTNPVVLAGLLATLGLAAVLIVSLRRTRAPLIGGLIFLALLLPTLGLVHYSWVSASDKYVYLPAIGLLMAGAGLLTQYRRSLGGRPTAIAIQAFLVAVLLVVGGAATWKTRGYLRQWRTTESLGRHMAAMAPQAPQPYSLLAGALADAGRTQEAMDLYRKAIQLDPSYSDAHYNFAILLAAHNRIEDAIEQYQQAVALSPLRAEAHNNLANLLARTGNFAAAVRHYARVLELRPGSPEAYYNLANALLAAGRPDAAIDNYRAALGYGSERAEIYSNLGLALGRCGDRKAAIAAYGRAAELDPRDPTIHYNLGNALAAMGRDAEAVTHYQRAIELRPEYHSAHNNLGNSLLKLGRREEAVAHYRQAIRLKPDYARGHMNLADALLEENQLEPALEHYREAVKLEPKNAGMHARLGQALERAGRPEQAVEEYKEALRINPQYAQARQRLEALQR